MAFIESVCHLFKDTDEEREARKTIRTLESKDGRLGGGDRHALRRARETVALIDQIRIVAAAAALGLVTIVGGVVVLSGESEKREIDSSNDDTSASAVSLDSSVSPLSSKAEGGEGVTPEKQTDRLIESFENGMARFKAQFAPNFSRMSGQMRILLEDVFWFVEENARITPVRNFYTYARSQPEGEKFSVIGVVNGFFYKVGDTGRDARADYAARSRAIRFNSRFNPDSMLDLSMGIHEAVHTFNDSLARIDLVDYPEKLEEYLDFIAHKEGEKPKCNIFDEAQAFAVELEVLNILLDGELAKVAASLSSIPETISFVKGRKAAQMLGKLGASASPDNRLFLAEILNLARFYFPEMLVENRFTNRFLREVARIYREMGYDIYIPNSEGRMVPYYKGRK